MSSMSMSDDLKRQLKHELKLELMEELVVQMRRDINLQSQEQVESIKAHIHQELCHDLVSQRERELHDHLVKWETSFKRALTQQMSAYAVEKRPCTLAYIKHCVTKEVHSQFSALETAVNEMEGKIQQAHDETTRNTEKRLKEHLMETMVKDMNEKLKEFNHQTGKLWETHLVKYRQDMAEMQTQVHQTVEDELAEVWVHHTPPKNMETSTSIPMSLTPSPIFTAGTSMVRDDSLRDIASVLIDAACVQPLMSSGGGSSSGRNRGDNSSPLGGSSGGEISTTGHKAKKSRPNA